MTGLAMAITAGVEVTTQVIRLRASTRITLQVLQLHAPDRHGRRP